MNNADSNSKTINSLWFIKDEISFLGISLLAGELIYLPMYANYLTNPDGIVYGITYKHYSEGGELGRIGIALVDKALGHVISPLMAVSIGIMFLMISLILIFDMFGIHGKVSQTVMAVVMLLSPVTSSTMTYYYCLIQYCIAFFLSTLSVWIIIRLYNALGKTLYRFISFIAGTVMLVISLSLYQAYLSIACLILLIHIICTMIDGEDIKIAVMDTIRMIVTIACAVLMYLVCIRISGVTLTSNRGFDRMGSIEACSLPGRFINTYHEFFDSFIGNGILNNSWGHRGIISLIILLLFVAAIIYSIVVQKVWQHPVRIIIIFACLICIPTAVELIGIIAPGVNLHGSTGIIIIPGMSLCYLLPFMIAPHIFKPHKAWNYGGIILYGLLIWNLFLFTMASENVMWLNDRYMHVLCEKISTQIDPLYFESPNLKVMIAGNAQTGAYPCEYPELMNIVQGSLASKGLVWDPGMYASSRSYVRYMRECFSIDYEHVSVEEYEELFQSPEYSRMSVFPVEGSVQRIDDTIVVKLSE